MPAILKDNSVIGMCHNCQDRTTFEFTYKGNPLNHTEVEIDNPFESANGLNIYQFCRCAVCGAGGLVIYQGRVGNPYKLKEFYPMDYEAYHIPKETPQGINSEFREAEKCSGIGAYRAGAAMLRSVLEKTLKDHGYTSRYLSENLKDAGKDKIITVPLTKRAEEVVKVLGDDVLHHEWREVTEEEFRSSHTYVQKILDAFYEYPEEVKKELEEKGRTVKKNEEKETEVKEKRAFFSILNEAGKIPSIPSK